jgi:hypothetical protein
MREITWGSFLRVIRGIVIIAALFCMAYVLIVLWMCL